MQAYSLSRILNDARQLTRSIHVSLAEMLCVFSHAQLSEVEKLLWLTIASHADRDSFSCTLSYAQLSHSIYQPTESVHRALKRLLALGFLECEGLLDATPLTLLCNCTFTVRLPLEGLLVLKKSHVAGGGAVRQDKYQKPITINLLNKRLI